MNTTTPPAKRDIPIHIAPHHLTLSDALCEYIRAKFAAVPRIAADALAVDVILRLRHGTAGGKRFTASARIALPGRDLHASASHADLYAAVVSLVTKLTRRCRKRKTRHARSRNRFARFRPALESIGGPHARMRTLPAY